MQPPQIHQHQSTVPKDGSNFTELSKLGKPQHDIPQESISSPVRVTRPPNAFLLFNKEMRKDLKRSNPTMKVGEISKEIGERWKRLSDAEKGRYVTEANNIKETQRALHPNSMYIRRSKAELTKAGHYARLKRKALEQQQQQALAAKNSNLSDSSAKGDEFADNTSNPSNPAIPNAESSTSIPKRRKRHKRDKNPAAPKHPLSAYMWFLTEVRPETMQTYPGSTVGQISKLCAERWKAMTDAERLPWHTKAQADKARYAREMQIYASQHDQPMGRGTRLKYRAAAAVTGNNAPPSESTGLSPSSLTGVHLSPNHNDLLLADTQPTSIPDTYNGDEHHHHHPPHHSLSVPSSPTALLHSSPLSPSSAAVPDTADVAAIFGTRRD